jgi:hypothetical protein
MRNMRTTGEWSARPLPDPAAARLAAADAIAAAELTDVKEGRAAEAEPSPPANTVRSDHL